MNWALPLLEFNSAWALWNSGSRRKTGSSVIDVMEDVDHMSKLVNELLAFSRAEINAAAVRLGPAALLPVVEAAVKRKVPPDTNIIVQIDPRIRVLASAALLTRAFANLDIKCLILKITDANSNWSIDGWSVANATICGILLLLGLQPSAYMRR